jgi:hypothetical protein
VVTSGITTHLTHAPPGLTNPLYVSEIALFAFLDTQSLWITWLTIGLEITMPGQHVGMPFCSGEEVV